MPSRALKLVAGVDEAGRGPLAGPVFAGAVILDPARPIAGLADSKKLTAAQRLELDGQIRDKALAFCVASASVEEVDRFNILRATMMAMRRAVDGLALKPDFVEVDGNRLPAWPYAARTVVGGDAVIPAISAASILAKVAHDALFAAYEVDYPGYGFAEHMGYATEAHLAALKALGPSPVHRKSFYPVSEYFAEKTDDLFGD